MKTCIGIAVCALLLLACGEEEAEEAGPVQDVFLFDSGGAHHIQGFGAWRVEASRDGRFQATHDVRGEQTVYDEVVLEPAVRAVLWAMIDTARFDEMVVVERPGVPDEARLTFTLQRPAGDPVVVEIWQNDARGRLSLVPLLQELKIQIAETYGVKPVF